MGLRVMAGVFVTGLMMTLGVIAGVLGRYHTDSLVFDLALTGLISFLLAMFVNLVIALVRDSYHSQKVEHSTDGQSQATPSGPLPEDAPPPPATGAEN